MAEQAQATPSWGPTCQGCGCVRLVHRGPAHDGQCASLYCAVDLVRGWSTTSRCGGYVGGDEEQTPPPGILPSEGETTPWQLAAKENRHAPPEATSVDDDPPIPDDDQDTPYARVREGGPS